MDYLIFNSIYFVSCPCCYVLAGIELTTSRSRSYIVVAKTRQSSKKQESVQDKHANMIALSQGGTFQYKISSLFSTIINPPCIGLRQVPGVPSSASSSPVDDSMGDITMSAISVSFRDVPHESGIDSSDVGSQVCDSTLEETVECKPF